MNCSCKNNKIIKNERTILALLTKKIADRAHGDRNHQPYANKKGSSVKCVEMRAPKVHKLIVQGIALGGHWGLHTPCMVAHRLFPTWLQAPLPHQSRIRPLPDAVPTLEAR